MPPGSPAPKTAPSHAPLVLWACASAAPGNAGNPAAALPCRVHALPEGPADARADTLQRALRALQPSVLVIDADWCQLQTRPTLDDLRRAAARARWLLVWREVSWPTVATLLDVDGRAAIDHDAPPEAWAEAVTAVLDGQVWLPRGAERWLYAKARLARRQEREIGDPLGLTGRETEVRALLEFGYTNKEIARELDISPNTVKKHIAAVFGKSGLRSRRQVMGPGAT
jgi:DNA-binding NarL/FixJ family response regulator